MDELYGDFLKKYGRLPVDKKEFAKFVLLEKRKTKTVPYNTRIDEDVDTLILQLVLNGKYKDKTEFVRQAILEKLKKEKF